MYRSIPKPDPGEYPAYAEMYMKWVPRDGQVLLHLENNSKMMQDFIRSLSPLQLEYRYAAGKWTIKEILVHITDDERIYSYRALCFARGEKKSLPGFEQDDYINLSETGQRQIDNILEEYGSVRQATIALFNGMTDEMLRREGTADNKRASVRALAYHIAGHELHHLNLIREKYLQ